MNSYSTRESAGLDIECQEEFTIKGLSRARVNVGKIKIKEGCVGFIMPRSGLSHKHDIVARLGVIDADYEGDIYVKLDNLSAFDHTFAKGDRIAQMVVVPFVHLEGYDIEDVERGEGGFGHTGK